MAEIARHTLSGPTVKGCRGWASLTASREIKSIVLLPGVDSPSVLRMHCEPSQRTLVGRYKARSWTCSSCLPHGPLPMLRPLQGLTEERIGVVAVIPPGSSHVDVGMSETEGYISIQGWLHIHCVARKDLELLILLPLAPKGWDYRRVPPKLSLGNIEDGTQCSC